MGFEMLRHIRRWLRQQTCQHAYRPSGRKGFVTCRLCDKRRRAFAAVAHASEDTPERHRRTARG